MGPLYGKFPILAHYWGPIVGWGQFDQRPSSLEPLLAWHKELVKAAAMQMEIHVSWVRTKMVLRCLNIMFLVRHIYIYIFQLLYVEKGRDGQWFRTGATGENDRAGIYKHRDSYP